MTPSQRSRRDVTNRSRGLAAAAVAILVTPVLLSTETPPGGERTRLADAYGQVPLAFEANTGQTDAQVAFLARGAGYALFLTPGEAVLSLHAGPPSGWLAGPDRKQATESSPPAVLRLRYRGANPSPRLSGLDPQAARSNYLVGSDRSRWRRDVPRFGKVRYQDVYPGIDVVYYGRQRQLEFDFVVQPGGDPRRIGLDFEGADGIETDPQGDLIVHVAGGALRQHKPVAYQEREGARQEVAAAYVVESERQAAFRLGDYDPSRPLVIDPVLAYSTYLGGSGHDFGYGIAVDGSGNAYVTGGTSSTNFPTVNPIQGAPAGGNHDVFVAKLDPTGSALAYCTYLGGSSSDHARGIAVDGFGNAYVTGFTYSTDFPAANPIQGALAGSHDALVAKLNAAGSDLVFSTYLGGSGGDWGLGIAVDGSGSAYVAGHTESTDFPTADPIQSVSAGGHDAFVAKLDAAGSALVYSTYLGGSGDDFGYDLAVDGSGNAYVTGYTESTNFPTANPLQAASAGNADVFVAKLNAAGSALVYSTYLGGSRGDWGQGIAVDGHGNAYVTGYTRSIDFPTVKALQGAHGGGTYDIFVTRLKATGTDLVYSTYLGGGGGDYGRGIAVDGSRNAHVIGHTSSTNFPTADPVQGANAGNSDILVAKLDPDGSALTYSTYLGGSGGDYGLGIALDGSRNAYVVGGTASTTFPTANPIQGANAGSDDLLVAKIALDPIFKDGFEESR